MEDDLNFCQMEDYLNILGNGRQHQYFEKWKTASIPWQMEDDLNIVANGRRPQYFLKWKTTSIFCQILLYGRQLQYFVNRDDLNILANG
jgi:hypothetical protein